MSEIRLPSFNVTSIITLRDKLMDRVFYPRYATTPLDADLGELVIELMHNLPGGIKQDTLFETARQLVGVPLTPEVCLEVAWLLAGNLPALRAGRVVTPWRSQPEDEWVPLQITAARPHRNKYNQIGLLFEFLVLAGRPSSLRIIRFWSRQAAQAIGRKLGFTPTWGKYPMTEGEQLVGLRLLGLIDAERSQQAPKFGEIGCPPSALQYNRDLLKLRFHYEPCPEGWTHPCHRCAVGYEECQAATHRKTYTQGFCDGCGEAEAYFDPDRDTKLCVLCVTRNALRHK
jgi:hypothetical protein